MECANREPPCITPSLQHSVTPLLRLILFLRLRGPRRFVLFGKSALLDARSLAQFAVHIC